MTRCFGNPGDIALDHLAQALFGEVILDGLASSELLDPGDALEDVLETETEAAVTRHQKIAIASAKTSRRSQGRSLEAKAKCVGRPSSVCRSSCRSTRSNRLK
jgi:hypothetical protein